MPSGKSNGRKPASGTTHLVTFFTWRHKPLFDELLLARKVVNCLRNNNAAHTLAHVIMPDRVLWLLQLSGGADLQATVNRVKSRSGQGINRFYGRTGRVWQPGFHHYTVADPEDAKSIARDIVAGPLRIGLAQSVRDYAHWDAIWLH